MSEITMPTSRRDFLKAVAGGMVLAGGGLTAPRLSLAGGKVSLGPASLPSGTLESAVLDALPGKIPLIKKTYRPPNYETPVEYFNEEFTLNNAFFVRWHLANIPEVNAEEWRLKIGGDTVEKPYELTLESLKKDFEPLEVAAVCLCSGNRRGLSDPHVPGVQWGYGAMGNARWRGARLKEILNKAGLKKEAVEIAFDGADSGVMKTPDFIKSIPVWKALDDSTLVAYEMNGEPLPHWNGYPARVVVPGWTATYWVKQVTSISAPAQPFKGFWMDPAYRIPVGKFPIVDRFITQETATTTPITEMVVNSLITNLQDGQRLPQGKSVLVKGIAWDGGYGIRIVEVSTDGGKVWREADLQPEVGRYAWRQWTFRFLPEKKGLYNIMAKASNRQGTTQTFELIFNPAGYHNNVVQKIAIHVA
jgi:DMSO/TMAO reductase YedYZ molybdopterin-dependent catalytic subunit